jgi:hypothetical protein
MMSVWSVPFTQVTPAPGSQAIALIAVIMQTAIAETADKPSAGQNLQNVRVIRATTAVAQILEADC